MKNLICFDLDGTLTINSTWEAFNARLGITPEDDQRLFEKYVKGEHSYKAWIMELMHLYTQNDAVLKQDIEDMARGMQLRPGAEALVNDTKQKGYAIVLISGSVDTVARECAARLHIGEWFTTNKAVYNEDNELIDIETMGDECDAKLLLLETFCLRNGYTLADTISVADGGNDLEILKKTKGILLGNNKELVAIAWKQVENLNEIPSLI